MSYTANALVQCENWQQRLGSVWNDMTVIKDPIPFLEYVVSPMNANMVNTTVNPGNGKTRTVVMTYTPPILESEVSETSSRTCTTDAVPSNRYQNYEIDTTDLLEVAVKITADQMATVCVDNPNFILEEYIRLMVGLDKKIASKSAAEAALLVGDYSTYVTTDGSTWTMSGDKLQVATKSSGSIIPGAWENISSAANASGLNGVVGFGGSALNEYMNLTMNGCCANQGLDVAGIYNEFGYAYGYDPRLASALGSVANDSLIMQPGAFQLLHYTQTPWLNGVSAFFNPGSYNAFATTTPAGVPVDVYVTDNCPGELIIKVVANTKLVALPSDMFKFGDPFEGVNGTAGVVVSNA